MNNLNDLIEMLKGMLENTCEKECEKECEAPEIVLDEETAIEITHDLANIINEITKSRNAINEELDDLVTTVLGLTSGIVKKFDENTER